MCLICNCVRLLIHLCENHVPYTKQVLISNKMKFHQTEHVFLGTKTPHVLDWRSYYVKTCASISKKMCKKVKELQLLPLELFFIFIFLKQNCCFAVAYSGQQQISYPLLLIRWSSLLYIYSIHTLSSEVLETLLFQHDQSKQMNQKNLLKITQLQLLWCNNC